MKAFNLSIVIKSCVQLIFIGSSLYHFWNGNKETAIYLYLISIGMDTGHIANLLYDFVRRTGGPK